MTPITTFAQFPLSVHTPDFLLTSSDASPIFSLRGQDKRGRPWHVVLRDASRGAWSSEAGGSRTYYFAGYTGATGSGPGTWILALSFDQSGQPVPFFVTTHGGYDAKGIEDVLDLDGRGPELLEQDYWGNIMDDPGYFVTAFYEQRGLYWYRSDGRHGAHVFPAFEKWSVMWKDRPAELTTNPPSKRPVRDSSNDPSAGIQSKLMGAEATGVRVGPEVGCETVGVQVLVTDSADGRTIDLQPDTVSLTRAARNQKGVVLTGLYRWPAGRECDASILWISAGR
jgi:hypothetical protein